jgi:hypothetical protein
MSGCCCAHAGKRGLSQPEVSQASLPERRAGDETKSPAKLVADPGRSSSGRGVQFSPVSTNFQIQNRVSGRWPGLTPSVCCGMALLIAQGDVLLGSQWTKLFFEADAQRGPSIISLKARRRL